MKTEPEIKDELSLMRFAAECRTFRMVEKLDSVVSTLTSGRFYVRNLSFSDFKDDLAEMIETHTDVWRGWMGNVWDRLDDATLAMGKVAYNIKSFIFPRIVTLRCLWLQLREYGDARSWLDPLPHDKVACFVKELVECYDLLITEVECMSDAARSNIWAELPVKRTFVDEYSCDDCCITEGMSCEEATKASFASASRSYEIVFKQIAEIADRLAKEFYALCEKAKDGEVGAPVSWCNSALKEVLKESYCICYMSFNDMDEYFAADGGFDLVTTDSVASQARKRLIEALRSYAKEALALARRISSKSDMNFLRTLELLDEFGSESFMSASSNEMTHIAEFIDKLDKAQEQLRRDVEIAKFGAKPSVSVEVADNSVKKLADATGKSVKKAIKPGKGSANERYPLKYGFQVIWDKYMDDDELKASLNHKVYHKDVFEYPPAHAEIVALRKEPPITFEEFDRSLGAMSDKNHRKSLAELKNKTQ